MPVFRIKKTSNYTVMANHHLRDKQLSLKAKGLLSLLLSLPDTWEHSVAGYAAICRDGVDGITTAIKELEAKGYIIRTRLRNEKGHFRDTEYTIFELPQIMETVSTSNREEPILEKPILDKPTLERPILENPTQLNTKLINTEELNKEVSNPNLIKQKGKKRFGHEMVGFDSLEELKEFIYGNIEYEHFKNERKDSSLGLIDEIAELIIETLCYTKETINIAGQEFPSALVKDRLMKLNSMHIDYVIECIDKNTTKIKNIKRYMLTTLFNAPTTIDAYYQTMVNHDLKR